MKISTIVILAGLVYAIQFRAADNATHLNSSSSREGKKQRLYMASAPEESEAEHGTSPEDFLPPDNNEIDLSSKPKDGDLGLAIPIEVNFGFMSGIRIDDLDWNIAAGPASDSTPNVLSELTWDNLNIFELRGHTNLLVDERFIIELEAAYGIIYDGEVQDSDFLGDNRTLEFSRSKNKSDGDDTFDFSGALGYRFDMSQYAGHIEATDLWFSLKGGYSYNEQNFELTDGVQVIGGVLGPFADLDSRYDAEWDGPWFGFDIKAENTPFAVTMAFAYHFGDFDATANWNLREDFKHPKSFEHHGDSEGFVYSVRLDYQFNDQWKANLSLMFQDWNVDDGTDRTFFSDDTTAETRLNEVNWESYSALLGINYQF